MEAKFLKDYLRQMLAKNTKFKNHRTDKTVVYVSVETNKLIVDRKLFFFYLVHLGWGYCVGEKNGR
jgi:hypothetical protein